MCIRDSNHGASPSSRLRGGILADAPGLGKSITLLSLIASTAGTRPQVLPLPLDETKLAEGWKGLSQSTAYKEDILKAIRPFRRHFAYAALVTKVQPPFSLEKFPTLGEWERFVLGEMKGHATDAELEVFRQNVWQIRDILDKSYRKIRMSEAGKRLTWERSLLHTSATLLVVPDPLLEHWFQQFHMHLNRALFADTTEGLSHEQSSNNEDARGVVYLDGVGDIADGRMPLGAVNMNSTELLKPDQLSKYLVVVTTFSRLEREYQREVNAGRMTGGGGGSGAAVARNGKRKKVAAVEHDDLDTGGRNPSNFPPSSLLQLRWLRIAVDEGHEISQEIGTGLTLFINQIAAERRWVLSGTPMTGDEDSVDFTSKALDQLQRLLLFLRHPIYGTVPPANSTPVLSYADENLLRPRNSRRQQKQEAKAKWVVQVKDPFLKKDPKGRSELLELLRGVMVMHRKEDIHLPPPIFHQAEVDVLVPEEIQKKLQKDAISSSTLLKEYLHSSDFQGLVDKAQGNYIIQVIKSAKNTLQANGGPLDLHDRPAMKMMSAEDVDENSRIHHTDRRPIKAVVYSSQKFNLRDVTEYLYEGLEAENIAEAYDDPRFDCSSELSRFRNNRKECRDCPVCRFRNDYSIRKQSRRKGAEAICQNTLLEVVLRDDPNVRFLVEQERVLRSLPPSEGGNVPLERLDGGYKNYGNNRRAYRVGDIIEVDIRDPHPLIPKRKSSEKWREYGSVRCVELADADNYEGRDWFLGPLPVVYEHIDEKAKDGTVESLEVEKDTVQVVLAKWQKCGTFHSASRWYEGPQLSQVPVQTIHEDVFVLVLDAGLATGLDLSFVTHIFLLEPVEDAALLEQITSRAHRLGATGPVRVETVNPFYKLDPLTAEALKKSKEVELPQKSSLNDNKKQTLTKSVCNYCYRSFDNKENAEDHEKKQCPRNPSNISLVDPWHLSSVYREIRPPSPRSATSAPSSSSIM